MQTNLNEPAHDEAYEQAHQRAEMIQGLYIHMLVFLAVNAGLFVMNWLMKGDDGGWWFHWATLGWGIGLVIHILVTIAPVFSPEWADRKAQRMLGRR